MKLLDAYCCQGGASAGYCAAGFYVQGVDINPQPRYPFPLYQEDAVGFIREYGDAYDFIHASPPCQAYSKAQRIRGNSHPDLIAETRDALNSTGRPWVIENVEEALPHMINPKMLCGASFGHLTYRHRYFETGGGFNFEPPKHPEHIAPTTKMGRPRAIGTYAHYVGNFSGVDQARADLGVFWMNRDGIRECIPPSYARYVGMSALRQIGATT